MNVDNPVDTKRQITDQFLPIPVDRPRMEVLSWENHHPTVINSVAWWKSPFFRAISIKKNMFHTQYIQFIIPHDIPRYHHITVLDGEMTYHHPSTSQPIAKTLKLWVTHDFNGYLECLGRRIISENNYVP